MAFLPFIFNPFPSLVRIELAGVQEEEEEEEEDEKEEAKTNKIQEEEGTVEPLPSGLFN